MKKFTLAQDKERYEILGIEYDPKAFGGIVKFKDLDKEAFKKLLDKGYINKNDRQNFSPSTAQFYKFMTNNDDFTAHGYLVINDRGDRRISIEGLEYHGGIGHEVQHDINNWLEMLKEIDEDVEDPDEYSVYDDYIWMWWD